MSDTALNRKFDLLAKSGTCPPYLLDVLTLLVAHTNETELFKKELRSAPFESAESLERRNAPPVCTCQAVQQKTKEDFALEIQQEVLSMEARVLRTAEDSLHAYAADLKKVNDISMATTSKSLRNMKEEVSENMINFRDRVVQATVEQTRDELDSIRTGLLESLDKDVTRLKAELHQVGLSSQQELNRMKEDFSGFVSKSFGLLRTEPLEEVHRVMAECTLLIERVKLLKRQFVPRVEMNVLYERVKNIESLISQGANCPGNLVTQCDVTTYLSPRVREVVNHVHLEFLGLQLRDDQDEVGGLIVTGVVPGSPASKAGIPPGFVILSVGDLPVRKRSEFAAALQQSGATVKLTVYDPKKALMQTLTV